MKRRDNNTDTEDLLQKLKFIREKMKLSAEELELLKKSKKEQIQKLQEITKLKNKNK